MNATHSHLPRLVLVTMAAALLTIVVMLALAPRLNELGSRSEPSAASSGQGYFVESPHLTILSAPAWLRNPAASPLRAPVIGPLVRGSGSGWGSSSERGSGSR